MTKEQVAVKRLFDVTASFMGLLFLWPILLICIVVARYQTGASGIFAQERVGQYGKLFTVYKIRTMDPRRTDFKGQETITLENDPRITSGGRLMRRYKLDELPQLWNVLVGRMSLVGPRPDVRGYMDKLENGDRLILSLRPGITGPSSIKYRNEERLLARQSNPRWYNDNVIFPDKVRLNRIYLEKYSIWRDISYILVTLGLFKVPEHLQVEADSESCQSCSEPDGKT